MPFKPPLKKKKTKQTCLPLSLLRQWILTSLYMIQFFHLSDFLTVKLKNKTCDFSMSKMVDKNTGECQKSRRTLELNFTAYECIRIPTTHSYFTLGRCKPRLRAQQKQLFPQGLLQGREKHLNSLRGSQPWPRQAWSGYWKGNHLFLMKATQKITEHSWVYTPHTKTSKFENYVIDINESGVCFRKRMKHKCMTEDNNKLGTSCS